MILGRPWVGWVAGGVLGVILRGGTPFAAADVQDWFPEADTTLLESAPDNNMGAEFHFAAGTTGLPGERTRNRGLLRFNLASLPAGARLQQVTVTLSVTGMPETGRANSTFALYRVAQSWGEGDKVGLRGDFATVGEATWNHRLAPGTGGTGGTAWTRSGAGAPGDYLLSSSATRSVTGLGTYVFGPTTNLVNDVQFWQEHPESNYGWMLISQSESVAKTARRFGSREDPGHAPVLRVEYLAPATPPRLEGITLRNGLIELNFLAQAGQAYAVEFLETLGSGSPWQTLTNVPGPVATTNLVVVDWPLNPQRFYRLRPE